MRSEGSGDEGHGAFGKQILRSDLHHTRPVDLARGKDGREIQVIREHDDAVLVGPRQDLIVGRGCRSDGGPMGRFKPVARQPVYPAWRQVHRHEQFHERLRGTSTSSARHAA